MLNVGSIVPLTKEDEVDKIMFSRLKYKGYHHLETDSVFYIEVFYPRDGDVQRVTAIQRLTVPTTVPKTVNFRGFLKNFHFIPSRFADTLRQTKSTTFTVVYEYVE